MLFGRASECGELDRLLARAREGRSDGLLLRGEAGIGKSALCEYAVQHAKGMTVLEACGAPAELELAYSGLADVLRPVLGLQREIPERQAAALASTLAIGPPLESGRFTICAATLSLLAAAAERNPVLVVVDEAQWLDASSTEALLFAARRLEADAVAFLFALREGHPSLLARTELRELRLAPLDREAALALLASHTQERIVDDVAEQLLQAAAGNPLALVELPGLLNQEQLSGREPLDEELPTTATLESAFLRQAELLPAECREALLVAAASDSGDLDVIEPALRALGNDLRSLEPAEEAGVLSGIAGRIKFRHPLLRAALYHAAPSVARRAAHQALAGVAAGDRELDRRAWHLAAAAPGQDDAAAEALEQAALAARRRGGRAEAASAFERAAELGVEGRERARRLREAAVDAWLVGRATHAFELLDKALEHAADRRVRAGIQHRRGVIEMWQGSPGSAHRLLVDEAAKVQELDRTKAARMLTDAAWASFMAAEITTGLETAQQAYELGTAAGGTAETLAKAALGIGLVLSGDAKKAVPLFSDYLSLLESMESPHAPVLYQPLRPDAQLLTWFEQFDRAREVLIRTIDSARTASALSALPYALSVLSDLDFRIGNWAAAYAGASEAVRIADETHQVTTLAFSLSCLARLEAAQGREAECRVHSEQALEIASPGISAVVALTGSGLGLLELGLGRLEEALRWLESLARKTAAHGLREPGVIPWAPDLIETYVRAGRHHDAELALEDFDRQARRTERASAAAAAARCRGLLASEDAFEPEFQKALDLHSAAGMPFERARTELCLGERLRRARRRADARVPLRSALEKFERLGAAPWSERARSELAASGETARRHNHSSAEELTPQELQVALLVARGATNREAGASLFLSPKTIEAHLGRVYRKLSIRSRTELAHLLGSEGALAGGGSAELTTPRETSPIRLGDPPEAT
jgi:DNA-binding CsgD family transcriptional regulator